MADKMIADLKTKLGEMLEKNTSLSKKLIQDKENSYASKLKFSSYEEEEM